MPALRSLFFVFLALAFLGAFNSVSAAQLSVAANPLVRPAFLLPIAEQLDQLLNGKTPTNATATGTPANAAPATTTGAPAVSGPAGENPEETSAEPVETFGTKELNLLLSFLGLLARQGTAFIENFADLPQVNVWFNRQWNDPRLQDYWHNAGKDLVLMTGVGFAGAFLFELLLLPARRLIRRRKPADFIRRLAAAAGLLALELLPVILFVAVSLILLNAFETQHLPRFVVLNVVYALTLNRLVMLAGQVLLAPRAPTLRLLPLTQPQVQYIYHWLGLFSFVAVYGYFCVDLAHSLRVPATAVNAFGSLLALILVVMTITVIAQKRAVVAVLLRGNLSTAQRDLTPMQSLRLWFARSWHVLAIAYLVIGYLVTALGIEGGAAILMRGTVLTFLVFVATGLALHIAGRLGPKDIDGTAKPEFHQVILLFSVRLTIWILATVGIAAAWGANLSGFLATPFGQRISGSLLAIGATVVVLALIYGFVSSSIERHLNRTDKEGRPVQTSARVRTLLPMLRNAAFIIFSIVAGMVILSEAGVNIGPLLAGAGVIGVAIGFGSQTLVKDFLTGLFIVIENTVAIGDVVKIADHSGVVEAMTVRTLRLRDADGAVHILPYSEVTKIINMTKDFAYALITIGVGYDSDLNRVIDVIKAVGEDMRQDAKLRASIIDPIEILGVDSFGESAIMLQARIRTRPGRQWDVKRALLLRLKQRFDQEKIEIPYPTVINLQRTAKN